MFYSKPLSSRASLEPCLGMLFSFFIFCSLMADSAFARAIRNSSAPKNITTKTEGRNCAAQVSRVKRSNEVVSASKKNCEVVVKDLRETVQKFQSERARIGEAVKKAEEVEAIRKTESYTPAMLAQLNSAQNEIISINKNLEEIQKKAIGVKERARKVNPVLEKAMKNDEQEYKNLKTKISTLETECKNWKANQSILSTNRYDMARSPCNQIKLTLDQAHEAHKSHEDHKNALAENLKLRKDADHLLASLEQEKPSARATQSPEAKKQVDESMKYLESSLKTVEKTEYRKSGTDSLDPKLEPAVTDSTKKESSYSSAVKGALSEAEKGEAEPLPLSEEEQKVEQQISEGHKKAESEHLKQELLKEGGGARAVLAGGGIDWCDRNPHKCEIDPKKTFEENQLAFMERQSKETRELILNDKRSPDQVAKDIRPTVDKLADWEKRYNALPPFYEGDPEVEKMRAERRQLMNELMDKDPVGYRVFTGLGSTKSTFDRKDPVASVDIDPMVSNSRNIFTGNLMFDDGKDQRIKTVLSGTKGPNGGQERVFLNESRNVDQAQSFQKFLDSKGLEEPSKPAVNHRARGASTATQSVRGLEDRKSDLLKGLDIQDQNIKTLRTDYEAVVKQNAKGTSFDSIAWNDSQGTVRRRIVDADATAAGVTYWGLNKQSDATAALPGATTEFPGDNNGKVAIRDALAANYRREVLYSPLHVTGIFPVVDSWQWQDKMRAQDAIYANSQTQEALGHATFDFYTNAYVAAPTIALTAGTGGLLVGGAGTAKGALTNMPGLYTIYKEGPTKAATYLSKVSAPLSKAPSVGQGLLEPPPIPSSTYSAGTPSSPVYKSSEVESYGPSPVSNYNPSKTTSPDPQTSTVRNTTPSAPSQARETIVKQTTASPDLNGAQDYVGAVLPLRSSIPNSTAVIRPMPRGKSTVQPARTPSSVTAIESPVSNLAKSDTSANRVSQEKVEERKYSKVEVVEDAPITFRPTSLQAPTDNATQVEKNSWKASANPSPNYAATNSLPRPRNTSGGSRMTNEFYQVRRINPTNASDSLSLTDDLPPSGTKVFELPKGKTNPETAAAPNTVPTKNTFSSEGIVANRVVDNRPRYRPARKGIEKTQKATPSGAPIENSKSIQATDKNLEEISKIDESQVGSQLEAFPKDHVERNLVHIKRTIDEQSARIRANIGALSSARPEAQAIISELKSSMAESLHNVWFRTTAEMRIKEKVESLLKQVEAEEIDSGIALSRIQKMEKAVIDAKKTGDWKEVKAQLNENGIIHERNINLTGEPQMVDQFQVNWGSKEIDPKSMRINQETANRFVDVIYDQISVGGDILDPSFLRKLNKINEEVYHSQPSSLENADRAILPGNEMIFAQAAANLVKGTFEYYQTPLIASNASTRATVAAINQSEDGERKIASGISHSRQSLKRPEFLSGVVEARAEKLKDSLDQYWRALRMKNQRKIQELEKRLANESGLQAEAIEQVKRDLGKLTYREFQDFKVGNGKSNLVDLSSYAKTQARKATLSDENARLRTNYLTRSIEEALAAMNPPTTSKKKPVSTQATQASLEKLGMNPTSATRLLDSIASGAPSSNSARRAAEEVTLAQPVEELEKQNRIFNKSEKFIEGVKNKEVAKEATSALRAEQLFNSRIDRLQKKIARDSANSASSEAKAFASSLKPRSEVKKVAQEIGATENKQIAAYISDSSKVGSTARSISKDSSQWMQRLDPNVHVIASENEVVLRQAKERGFRTMGVFSETEWQEKSAKISKGEICDYCIGVEGKSITSADNTTVPASAWNALSESADSLRINGESSELGEVALKALDARDPKSVQEKVSVVSLEEKAARAPAEVGEKNDLVHKIMDSDRFEAAKGAAENAKSLEKIEDSMKKVQVADTLSEIDEAMALALQKLQLPKAEIEEISAALAKLGDTESKEVATIVLSDARAILDAPLSEGGKTAKPKEAVEQAMKNLLKEADLPEEMAKQILVCMGIR